MKDPNMMNTLSLREIQLAGLKILDELTIICKEHGFKYSLAYGTLIGAIRHKGFIPWDDDIDIIMPRKDYDKLKHYLKTMYNGKLKWCDRITVINYPYCISRVSNMEYRYYTKLPNQKDFDIGIFVDIYPLDNYCDSKKDALRLGRKCWIKNRLFDIYLNPDKTKCWIKKIMRNIVSLILHYLHGSDWQLHIDDEIKAIIDKNTKQDNKIVGVISQYEWRELMKKEWFDQYVEVEFENRKFMACGNYHEFLTSIYGDYMQLPNENERIPTHGYEIIRR